MSGHIDIYKIDSIKIKEKLYPKLINTELPEIYIPESDKPIYYFKKFLEVNKDNWDYQDASFEKIIEKLESDNFTLTSNEFTAINDWFRWYHRDNIYTDEIISEDYGFIEIGSLHTRYETSAFFGLGSQGIEDYLFPIWKPDFEWNDANFPLNHEEFILMIDYMVVLCIKIATILEYSVADEMIKNFNPESFNNISNLQISAEKHVESYLADAKNMNYSNEMKSLFMGYYEHFPYILVKIKKNLGDYDGLLYKDDCY